MVNSKQDYPEFYKDTGCSLAAFCLSCPFPKCVYDIEDGRTARKQMRYDEIVKLSREKTDKELATHFNVSVATIGRALR